MSGRTRGTSAVADDRIRRAAAKAKSALPGTVLADVTLDCRDLTPEEIRETVLLVALVAMDEGHGCNGKGCSHPDHAAHCREGRGLLDMLGITPERAR